jgi:hypothetical protein
MPSSRLRRETFAAHHEPEKRQRQHGAGGVVHRRLGDQGLRHLRPQPHPFEEGDQDGRIGGRQHRPDEEAHLDGNVEHQGGDQAAHHRGHDHPGDDEHAQTHGHLAQHTRRKLQATVEKNERDTQGEQHLDARGVERQIDDVGH